ncbi:MAG TPA: hypothetical protein VK982_15940 [Bacteroidales bacterium]|nr:hypothetical protein [Bacteroidales bacterium]
MISKLNNILSTDFEEIANSSLSLDLLNIYSYCYLKGKQPNTCKASLLRYYQKIIKNKNKIIEKMEKQTNKCKLIGIKYIGKPLCKHYNLQNLTDVDAHKLLDKGYLKEKDFSKLPESYLEEKEIEKQIKAEEKKKTAKKDK